MYTVDIDTGGTYTDGLFSGEKKLTWVKVDTTPHDLTIAFSQCLEEGSQKLGFKNITDFLDQVDIIRWSSTVASNVLAEKTGPRLGLFVVKGSEDSLYSSTVPNPSIGFLIDRANIIGLSQPVDTTELLKELKGLLEQGVRRMCICLKGSFYDNRDELQIKNIITEQYSEHYLGSVPVLTGEEICKHPDDMTRTHMALLNAYVHGPMASSLFKQEDELREKGYILPLLIGHIDGGVARVSKTTPLHTIEAGPIFGIHGAAYFARMYNLKKVITLDVGGTTSKIGLIIDGRPVTSTANAIFNIPLNIPLITLNSLALGGGTIARAGSASKIKLGPKSMGSYPGPACYDLGGTEATLTDALLILKYFDPDYYAGGTRKLNVTKATQVIQDRVAKPLGTDLVKAAYGIMDEALRLIADEIKKLIEKTRTDPKEFALFAFGGNGGIFGCNIAEKIGANQVYIFSVGPVFSAFGASTADISHTYEYAPFVSLEDFKGLRKIVSQLRDEALRDMKGEGLELAKVKISLDLEISAGENPPVLVESHYLDFDSEDDVEIVRGLFTKKALFDCGRDKLVVELLRLRAHYPSPGYEPAVFQIEGPGSEGTIKHQRDIFWADRLLSTNVYDWDLLKSGNIVSGPAIIEATDTTHLVPIGWELKVDKYKNGLIKRKR